VGIVPDRGDQHDPVSHGRAVQEEMIAEFKTCPPEPGRTQCAID
jgi:hypothetical protein